MKTIKFLFALIMIVSVGTFVACNNAGTGDQTDADTTQNVQVDDHAGHDHGDTAAADSTAVDTSGPEYTSAYICAMHCKGSGSDKAGNCSGCGMALIENPTKQQ